MGIKNVILYTLLIVIFIYFAPNLPPHAEFDVIEVVRGRPLEGPLSPNSVLDNAERLHENVLHGPESIAYRSTDEIFVGLYGGDIVKIYGSDFEKTKVVANNGPGCAGYWEEAKCGRPLGLRFHNDGLLYVTDAYLGVFAVNVDTGTSTNIFNLSKPIEGVVPRIADDLDIDKDGNIYWSDASTVASLDSGALEVYANPSGRLIKYDIKKKKHTVLLDKLHFANGVQLSHRKDFVLVAESNRKRILRYWLEGPKTGSSDVFVSNLPGMPDNIRKKPEGGYHIAIAAMDNDFLHNLNSFFAIRPTLKRFLCRIFAIMAIAAEKIEKIIPNKYCKDFIFGAFNFHTLARWVEIHIALVVELNENGDIVGSLHGSNGQVKGVTEAHQVGNNIFFGSLFSNYLGRIKITDISNNEKITEVTPENLHEKYEL